MAAPSTPTNFNVQQGNGQVFVSFDISSGATGYDVQRSDDGVVYASIASPTLPQYLDTTVVLGIKYYYKVAAFNADGDGQFTVPQFIIPTPTSEMSLGGLRLASQQKADRVNSNFITLPEWNFFINLAMYELYDLLIDQYEDYFMAPRARFNTTGSQWIYPLPDGAITFTGVDGSDFVAQPFYKLLGVDLAVNNANNAFVTVDKYMLLDRNRYIYPNTASTIYGVFNMQYRLLGTNIEFIPTPSANQQIQLLYIPRLPQLLQDTDITTIGFSGWLQYVIVRAAKYALDKEESDTTKQDSEIAFLKDRIEASASNRDAGRPDKISDVNRNGYWGQGGYGYGGAPSGGF